MPCYFVSSGVEIPMTNETFDFIWNGFGNKELTDSETSSSYEEGDKTGLLVEKARNAQWRKQDNGYYNRKPNDEKYFQRYYQEKTKQPCVCDVCGSVAPSLQGPLQAQSRKTEVDKGYPGYTSLQGSNFHPADSRRDDGLGSIMAMGSASTKRCMCTVQFAKSTGQRAQSTTILHTTGMRRTILCGNGQITRRSNM